MNKEEKSTRKAWRREASKLAHGDLESMKNLKVSLTIEVMELKKALFWNRIIIGVLTVVILILAAKLSL